MLWLVLVASLIGAALIARSSAGAAETNPAQSQPEAVPGQLVVGFDDDVSSSVQRKTVTKAGGRIEDHVDSIDSLVVTPRGSRSAEQVADELSQAAPVEFVEPNYIVRSSRLPNDPGFDRQWGLRNTGQQGGRPGADIDAATAWDALVGGDVTVAIVDTGIDYGHADLAPNMWINPGEVPGNGVDDDHNGYVDDIRGYDFANEDTDPYDDASHGTHVAGIIGARGNNGVGTAGVDWNVRLLPLKFLNSNGDGNTADAADAIDYAANAGARVVNASWGGPSFSFALYKAIKNAAARGVLVVAAAGNEGQSSDSSPQYPAAYDLPNIVSVAATDPQDSLVDFSNYGVRTVDLAAPGEDIYSTVPRRNGVSGYSYYSGTSMATPFVSGAAALYMARNPAAQAAQTRDAILQSVDPLPALAGRVATGGRLDLAKALGVGRTVNQAPAQPAGAVDTGPTPFRLISPRNRYVSSRRGVRFRWQRSHDTTGIRVYKFFVDGHKRKTVRDPDGRPGGREPRTRVRYRLRGGRHHWFVRAYDYAGKSRKSTRSRRGKRAARVLFIDHRRARRGAHT